MSTKGDTLPSMTKMFLRGTQILLAEKTASDRRKDQALPHFAAGVLTGRHIDGVKDGTGTQNPLNRAANTYEQTEIKALIFYASQKTGADEASLILRLMDDLGLTTLSDLNLGDYRVIRAYMWTLLANVA